MQNKNSNLAVWLRSCVCAGRWQSSE